MFASITGFSKKLLSAFISCALVASMVPAASVAYAAEETQASSSATQISPDENTTQTDAAQDRVYESVALDTSKVKTDGTDTQADINNPSAGSSNAMDVSQNPVDVATPESGTASSSASETNSNGATQGSPAAEDIEMVQAQLSLDAAETVVSYNGLSYVVNEDEQSVTLVGWSTKAPTGALIIPEKIMAGSNEYTVTDIAKNVLGGGSTLN